MGMDIAHRCTQARFYLGPRSAALAVCVLVATIAAAPTQARLIQIVAAVSSRSHAVLRGLQLRIHRAV
jgi:hypothetical protein